MMPTVLALFGTATLFLVMTRTRIPLSNILVLFVIVVTMVGDAVRLPGTSLSLLNFVLWAMLLVLVVAQLLNRDCRLAGTPFDRLILAFALVNIAVIAISVYEGNSLGNAVREFFCYFRIFLALYLFLNMAATWADLAIIVAAAFGLCLVSCLFGIAQTVLLQGTNAYIDSYGRIRIYSFFGNPNSYAAYLELMYYPCLSLLYYYRTRSRALTTSLLCLVLLIVVNMLLTLSRGVFVTTVLFTIVFVVSNSKDRLGLLIKGGTIILLGTIAIAPTFQDLFARQVSMVTDFPDVLMEMTLLHRIAQYLMYIHIIQLHPFAGMGWGVHQLVTFTSEFVRGKGTIMTFGGLNSIYFDLAVKSGLVSLTLFAAIFLAFGRHVGSRLSLLSGHHPMRALATGVLFAFMALAVRQTVDNLMKFAQIGYIAALFMAISIKGIALSVGREERYVLR